MYNQTFEEYLEKLDKRCQWILLNGKKINDNNNKIAFIRQSEKNQDIVILNERYVITEENNKDQYNLFVNYSILSNILYNSATKLYRKQFFNKSNFDSNILTMKFYQDFKNDIFNNIQCDFETISKEELELRNIFIETPNYIRLGVIYDVSNKWYKFMEHCYKYYLKEIETVPSIPKIRKGKNRRNSFTINPDTIRVISNPEYIHPTNREKRSKYSKNSIINYRNIIILPKEFGNLRIPSNCYKGNITEIRITPNRGIFNIDIKYTRQINLSKKFTKGIYFKSKNRIAGIDFGLNNLMAVANNTGSKPLLIKGKRLTRINIQYNDLLKKCKFNSNKYNKLEKRRQNIMYDYLNKSIKYLINYLEINQIGTLVIGINDSMLENSFLTYKFISKNKNFKTIDYKYLINKIKIECKKINIDVIEVKDENKLSLITAILDNKYSDLHCPLCFTGSPRLPGLRLLESKRFGLVNCDINSATNIILKYRSTAFKYILDKIKFDLKIDYMKNLLQSNIDYIIYIKNLKMNKKIKLIFRHNSIYNANDIFGKLLKNNKKSDIKISIYSKSVTFNTLKKSVRKSMAFMFSPIIINI